MQATTSSTSTTSKLSHRSISSLLSRAKDLDTVSRLVDTHRSSFNEVNVATAVLNVGRLLRTTSSSLKSSAPSARKLVKQLSSLLRDWTPNMTARQASNCMWGLAALHGARWRTPPSLFQDLAGRAVAVVESASLTELSSMLWACGKVKHSDRGELVALLSAFSTATVKDPEAASSRHLATVLYACATLSGSIIGRWGEGAQDPVLSAVFEASLEELYGVVQTRLASKGGCDSFALSNIAWSMVVLKRRDPELLGTLRAAVLGGLSDLSPQGTARLASSLSQLGLADEEVLAAIAEHVPTMKTRISAIDVASIAHVFAKEQFLAPGLFEYLQTEVLERLGDLHRLKPKHLAMLVVAFGKEAHAQARLQSPTPGAAQQRASTRAVAAAPSQDAISETLAFLDKLSPTILAVLPRMGLQECGQLLSGYMKLSRMPPELFEATWQQVVAQQDGAGRQYLTGCLYSGAVLGRLKHSHVLAVWSALAAILSEADGRQLANSMWALGRLRFVEAGREGQELFGIGLNRAIELMPRLGPKDVATLVTAAGQANVFDEDMLDAAAASLVQRDGKDRVGPLQLSSTLWGFTRLSYYNQPFMAMVVSRTLARGDGGVPADGASDFAQDLSNVLYGVATLSVPATSPQLQRLFELYQGHLRHMDPGAAVCAAWSLAVCEALPRQSFSVLLTYLREDSARELRDNEVLQLLHTFLMLETLEEDQAESGGDHRASSTMGGAATRTACRRAAERLGFPGEWFDRAEGLWAEDMRDGRISRFHQDVSGALREMGVPHTIEHPVPGLPMAVDIAIITESGQLAVEVDGPHHYTINAPYRMLGHTRARRRLLHSAGWRVVAVPFYVWTALHKEAAKIAYLTESIQEVL